MINISKVVEKIEARLISSSEVTGEGYSAYYSLFTLLIYLMGGDGE